MEQNFWSKELIVLEDHTYYSQLHKKGQNKYFIPLILTDHDTIVAHLHFNVEFIYENY